MKLHGSEGGRAVALCLFRTGLSLRDQINSLEL
jgi:hypothetical protein